MAFEGSLLRLLELADDGKVVGREAVHLFDALLSLQLELHPRIGAREVETVEAAAHVVSGGRWKLFVVVALHVPGELRLFGLPRRQPRVLEAVRNAADLQKHNL